MPSENVQFGCGFRTGPSWLNFDISPTLRLSKVPGLKSLLRLPNWPANALYGDVLKGLPVGDASCRRLYCDQVLEHLSRDDVHRALSECRRVLAKDGVFRLFVPDLRRITVGYTEMVQQGRADAGAWFMEATGLGFTQRPRGFMGRLRDVLGNARHLWAWDVGTMTAALRTAGFTQVREVSYRDSDDAIFNELENGVSWELALGMEARL